MAQVDSGKSHCNNQARQIQTHLNYLPSDLNLLLYTSSNFLFSTFYWHALTWPCRQFFFFYLAEKCHEILKVQISHFLYRLLTKEKKKKEWGAPMWMMSKSRTTKIPLFSVCKAFLTCFRSLHVNAEQRPALWSFCCVCGGWVNNFSL